MEIGPTETMIALHPPRSICKQLKVPGGLHFYDLHITLAYLGTFEQHGIPRHLLEALLYDFAPRWEEFPIRVNGFGTFEVSDGDVLFASVDSDHLYVIRSALLSALGRIGAVEPEPRADYKFHMSLKYTTGKIERLPAFKKIGQTWRQKHVSLAIGPSSTTDFMLRTYDHLGV